MGDRNSEGNRQKRHGGDAHQREDGGGERRRPDHDRRGVRLPQLREVQGMLLANEIKQEGLNEKPPNLAVCSHLHRIHGFERFGLSFPIRIHRARKHHSRWMVLVMV